MSANLPTPATPAKTSGAATPSGGTVAAPARTTILASTGPSVAILAGLAIGGLLVLVGVTLVILATVRGGKRRQVVDELVDAEVTS